MNAHGYIVALDRLPAWRWRATLLDTSTGHVVDDTMTGANAWATVMEAVERANQFGPTRHSRRLPFIFGARRAFVDVSSYGTRAWDHAAAKRVAARLGAK